MKTKVTSRNIIAEYECDWTSTIVVYGQSVWQPLHGDTGKPSRRVLGTSCPDVEIGHIIALGRPPLATHQPPTSPIANGALANGDPAEVPNRSLGELAALSHACEEPAAPTSCIDHLRSDPSEKLELTDPEGYGMFTQLPPNMQIVHGVSAIGDPAEVPSRNPGAHAAPPLQDKQAITPAIAVAPVVGNCALTCLAGLGRPPERTSLGTGGNCPVVGIGQNVACGNESIWPKEGSDGFLEPL